MVLHILFSCFSHLIMGIIYSMTCINTVKKAVRNESLFSSLSHSPRTLTRFRYLSYLSVVLFTPGPPFPDR